MTHAPTQELVDRVWEHSIVPALERYIAIPNKSPAFDPEWEAHGHMTRAFDLAEEWCRAQPIDGLRVERVQLPGRTPLLLAEVPGDGQRTVLLYGHLDKQPEMVGWTPPFEPWKPVRRGDLLYGRGGADDGYAVFASLLALRALRDRGGRHARAVVLIEGCEESGSYDLPAYIEHLAPRIGEVDLVVCLDSGCGNYEALWSTTSLRGLVNADLTVSVLSQGVHSGGAGGIVPSTFGVLRQLLGRLEESDTGHLKMGALHVEIPEQRRRQAAAAAEVLGDLRSAYPLLPGVRPLVAGGAAQILARTWQPCLEITGAAGLPAIADAGNVLRPSTTLKLSIRLPPTADARAAGRAVKELLEAEPPHGAHVEVRLEPGCNGWNAPALAPWLERALAAASTRHFGAPAVHMGEGGTIPFMAMLGERFPAAQFVITGVLGPGSNAHGPNEYLHIGAAKKLTACVADIIEAHGREVLS